MTINDAQRLIDYVMDDWCPDRYVNIDTPYNGEWCGEQRCEECWDREIPGTEPLTYEHTGKPIGSVKEVTEDSSGMCCKVELNEDALEELEDVEDNIDILEKKLKYAEDLLTELSKQLEDLKKCKKYEYAAGEIRGFYLACMNEGFSSEQAFELIKIALQNSGNRYSRGY